MRLATWISDRSAWLIRSASMNFDEQQSLDALEILSFSAALDSGIVPRFFFFFVLLLRSRCTLHRLNRLERLTDSISCVLFSSLALMRHTIRAATGALLPIKINQSVHQQETLRCHTSNRQFSQFSARVLSLARRPERGQHFGRLIFLCSALCLGSPLHAAARSFLLFFFMIRRMNGAQKLAVLLTGIYIELKCSISNRRKADRGVCCVLEHNWSAL